MFRSLVRAAAPFIIFCALTHEPQASEADQGGSVLGAAMAAIAICDLSNVVPTPAMKALHAHVIDTRYLDSLTDEEYRHYQDGQQVFWKRQEEEGSLKACKWMALSFPEYFIDIVP
jgi:hypothetical protein